WPSALSAEKVFAGNEQVTYLRPCSNGVFFVLNMLEEGNIQALMHLTADGRQTRVSPLGINVRSRVHEYGGMPYAFTDNSVFFCNFRDQRVMKQSYNADTCDTGPCEVLTPLKTVPDDQLRYVDFIVDSKRKRLICVREDHRNVDAEPVNVLVAIDMDSGGEEVVLFEGADFVAAPALSADSSMLTFQTWSHPNMPW